MHSHMIMKKQSVKNYPSVMIIMTLRAIHVPIDAFDPVSCKGKHGDKAVFFT